MGHVVAAQIERRVQRRVYLGLAGLPWVFQWSSPVIPATVPYVVPSRK